MIKASNLALRLLLAAVLLWSAAEKALRTRSADPQQRTVYDHWIGLGTAGHYALIAVEVTLAAWLLSGRWPRAAAIACGVLLMPYAAVLGLELRKAQPLPCGCFFVTPGADDPDLIRRGLALGIARNLLLTLACVWVVLTAPIKTHAPNSLR